jgi:hypothetical protein
MCPIHVAPAIRAREDAAISAGLLVNLNSDGFNELKSLENAGATFRESPKTTYLFNGFSSTPAQIPSGS